MPKESITPVERGPGSISPDFSAPEVGVATPGASFQAQVTPEEQFRDAVLSFGQGIARAANAQATIQNRINSLKEQSMAKVESDLNRAARAFQVRRLESADQKRREIVEESAERGVEWAEREFRSRMVNAGSAQEAQIWETAWRGAANQVSRENAQEKEQSFNRAKMTMTEVAVEFSASLEESPEAKVKLVGDGTGIAVRVQNSMLEMLRKNVDLDALDTEDAELLVHQTIVQAARIADSLRGEHQKTVEDSHQRLGARQLEADLFSTVTNEQDAAKLGQQIEVNLRDNLSHLTIEQQNAVVRDAVSNSLATMAQGGFGLENFDLDQASKLLNLKVGGEPVFTDAERVRLEANLFAAAERTVANEMETRVATLREGLTETVNLPDGTQVSVPVLDADARLTARGETGVSELDLLADRLINEAVPEDKRDTLAGQRIVGLIRAEQAKVQGRINAGSTQWEKKTFQSQSFYAGGTEVGTDDANTSYDYSPESRVLRSQHSLAAQGNRPPAKQEIDHLRSQYFRIAEVMGLDRRVVAEWDGSQIGSGNVELRQIAEAHHANLHNQVQQMPPAAVREKIALLESDDTNDLRAFGAFISTLDGGPSSAYQRFVADAQLSDSQRAAVIHIRKTLKLGSVSFSPDGDPIFQTPDSEAVDFERLRAVTEQIRNTPQQRNWLFAPSSEERGAPRNVELLAASWAEGIMSSRDPRLYGATDWDINSQDLTAGLIEAVTNNSTLSQWVSAVAQSQSAIQAGLDHDGMAAVIGGWMERAGMRVKQTNGTVQLLQDPFNYAGEPGQDVDEHANEVLNRGFAPWYREVLAEALDIPVGRAPANLQGLYLLGREGVVSGGDTLLGDTARPLTDAELAGETESLRAFHGANFADNQLRLLPVEAGGGSPVYVQTRTGVLGIPTAKRDVEVTRPDGTVIRIQAGQALNVYNPAQFVPQSRRTMRSRDGLSDRPEAQSFDFAAWRNQQPIANVPQP